MQRVKARAPAQYRAHVADTEKRLNILFDHLNNEDLLKPDTIDEMNELARYLQEKNYDQATALFTDLMTNKTDEGSNWMVCSPISFLYKARLTRFRLV
jgi:protein transport protein SEC31